jgi:hypothetical protein
MPDPRATRAFQTVQDQVEKYRSGFPKEFKDPIRGMDGDDGAGLDGDLLLGTYDVPIVFASFALLIKLLCMLTAHLIPFVAMIVLHENHVDLMNKDDVSSKMMLTAARGMLSVIFLLLSTSYELVLLPLHHIIACTETDPPSLFFLVSARYTLSARSASSPADGPSSASTRPPSLSGTTVQQRRPSPRLRSSERSWPSLGRRFPSPIANCRCSTCRSRTLRAFRLYRLGRPLRNVQW